jgi:hypothetical protein
MTYVALPGLHKSSAHLMEGLMLEEIKAKLTAIGVRLENLRGYL